jgi:hypothetical protein
LSALIKWNTIHYLIRLVFILEELEVGSLCSAADAPCFGVTGANVLLYERLAHTAPNNAVASKLEIAYSSFQA